MMIVPVSDIPWKFLYIGMQVFSVNDTPGQITELTPSPDPADPEKNYVGIHWKDGSFSFQPHHLLKLVTS